MRRTLPLVALLAATLPFAVAAPVPKTETAIATSYTADQLAKLPFVDADAVPKGQADGYPKAGTLALALTLPKAVYTRGEPIVPLFAVKNRTGKPLGLDMGFDTSGSLLAPRNSCEVHVRDAESGRRVGELEPRLISCGGSLGTVREGGYLTASGNVTADAADKTLPPGRYELSWKYGWAESNVVKFTVIDQPFKKGTPYRYAGLLHVTEFDTSKELAKAALAEEGPRAWKEPAVERGRAADAAAALGDGTLGRYYPSLRSLPEAAGKLRADVTWTTKDRRDSFTVSLAVTDPDAKVAVRDDLYVYLLYETDVAVTREVEEQDRMARKADVIRVAADTPYELTVHLPAGWAERCGTSGPGRVTVVLATRELESDGRRDKVERLKRADDAGDFVVRTPWRAVTFPDSPKDEKKDR